MAYDRTNISNQLDRGCADVETGNEGDGCMLSVGAEFYRVGQLVMPRPDVHPESSGLTYHRPILQVQNSYALLRP